MKLNRQSRLLSQEGALKIIVIILSLFFSFSTLAHSGRTNSAGCHHDRINGGYHCHNSEESPVRDITSNKSETVRFNTKTHKIHRPSCSAAGSCTVNCISISKKEAVKRGGVPCGLCGG